MSLPCEIIYNILLNNDYGDIVSYCQVDDCNICNDKIFWYNKLKIDYPDYLDEMNIDPINFYKYVHDNNIRLTLRIYSVDGLIYNKTIHALLTDTYNDLIARVLKKLPLDINQYGISFTTNDKVIFVKDRNLTIDPTITDIDFFKIRNMEFQRGWYNETQLISVLGVNRLMDE